MKILDDEKDLLMDHEYDGIKELDNHMPRWWLYLFYFTIIWGFLYMVYYVFTDVGLDQHEEYQAEMAMANEHFGLTEQNDGDENVATVWAFETDDASIENGKTIYMAVGNLCFTCHGNSGEGMVGPNLTDNLWINGCSASDVATSIINGFPDKGMMAYGSGARLADDDLTDLISYIATLQGSNPDNAKPADEARAVECTIP